MTSRMTATDELRRLLDERGATVDEMIYPDRRFAFRVVGSDAEIILDNSYGKTGRFAVFNLTPEQAIEATLGRGTCRDLAETPEYRDKTEFKCSECGYEYSAVGGFGCDCGDEPDFRYCPSCGRKVVDA